MMSGAKAVKNRKPETRDRKPASVCGASRTAICRMDGSLGAVLFSIFLTHAAYAVVPTATPAAIPGPAHAPEGFGAAKFGMTLEEVRQVFPALVPAPLITSAAYFRSPNLTRYWMTKVDVPGLQNQCSVEFRFWKNQLWSVIVYYGTNPFPVVVENLQRTYALKPRHTPDPSWDLGSATITTSPGQMWYSFDNTEIGKAVQHDFIEAIRQQHARKAAALGGTPRVAQTPGTPGTPAAPPP